MSDPQPVRSLSTVSWTGVAGLGGSQGSIVSGDKSILISISISVTKFVIVANPSCGSWRALLAQLTFCRDFPGVATYDYILICGDKMSAVPKMNSCQLCVATPLPVCGDPLITRKSRRE